MKEEILWSFIQVSDERGNAIGEFVTSPPSQTCGSASANGTAVPKDEQFLPCSATGLQEATSSQNIVYTKKSVLEDTANADQFLGSPNNPTVGLRMKFTWRLNEYFCNRHARFRIV